MGRSTFNLGHRGAPVHLISFGVALFLESDLRVGDAVAQLVDLNAICV